MTERGFSIDAAADRAWLDFRVALADRLLAETYAGPIDISAPDDRTLTAGRASGQIVVSSVDMDTQFDSVDEAAHFAYRTLHEQWGVVHPQFLTTDLVAKHGVVDETHAKVAPATGTASTSDELLDWMVATFNQGRDEPVRVSSAGQVRWRIGLGDRVIARVIDATSIEFSWTVAFDVSLKKARKWIDLLSERHPAMKFALEQDTLVMSYVLVADPFVPALLTNALTKFVSDARRLDWVQAKVLRKRARVFLAELAALEDALEEARDAVQAAEDRAAEAQRKASAARRDANRRRVELVKMRIATNRVTEERDEALAEVERLRAQGATVDPAREADRGATLFLGSTPRTAEDEHTG